MYQILARNKQGLTHIRNHQPCQDRYLTKTLTGPGKDSKTILVVADGHGSPTYTRSGLGARIACSIAVKILSENVSKEDFPAVFKDEFDRKIEKHLIFRPLENWEIERVGSHTHTTVYGTTLVVSLLTPASATVFQLGDGGAFFLNAAGHFLPAIPPDPCCVGCATSSLIYPKDLCLKHFRVHEYSEPVAAAFLFSDGYGFSPFDYPYPAAVLSGHPEQVSPLLDTVLKKGDHGDDQTLLFAYDLALCQSPSFYAGLNETLAEGMKKKQRAKLLSEIEELKAYQETIRQQVSLLQTTGSFSQLSSLMNAARPKLERLRLLKSRLDSESL